MISLQVCGNDASVNFLRDWLHSWHERRYQSRKDASNRDKSNMQDDGDDDDEYLCSHSDCDSEDMNEEDSLQNVLLITGPIGVCGCLLCQNCACNLHELALMLIIYTSIEGKLLFANIINSFREWY